MERSTLRIKSKTDKEKKSRLIYPNLKSVIVEIITNAKAQFPEEFEPGFNRYDKLFDKLDLMHEFMKGKDPRKQQSFVLSTKAKYKAELSFRDAMERFKSISVRPNEFYAIFDLKQVKYIEVDGSIRSILGIEPEDFSVPAMLGLCDDNRLYHEQDLNHMLRWASIAFFLFTLELLRWTSMQDQYRVSFRVGTSGSKLSSIRSQDYVTLEKLCFIFYDSTESGSTQPLFHFDKWLVYPESECDYVKPSILSTPSRQVFLNDFLYLINAYIIGIPSQYLLFLHEASKSDRNKAIAQSLTANLKSHANIDSVVEEQQVADCFAKTIRKRVSQAMNVCDKRKQNDLIHIDNDHEMVRYAKVLGLLPIPKNVLECMYRNVIVND